jgi:glycerol-3-phosphate dehydrogenase
MEPLSTDSPVLCAEIAYARLYSMAVTLEDAVYRRTALGGTGRVSAAALAKAAEAFGA